MKAIAADRLTDEQILAVVQGWFDAGLPVGRVSINRDTDFVMITIPGVSTYLVDMWARALGGAKTALSANGNMYGLAGNAPRPKALAGLSLDVWCSTGQSVLPAAMGVRIEVLP